MKITICGSISFLKEIEELSEKLKNLGFEDVHAPKRIPQEENSLLEENHKIKIELDLINAHWHKILKSDCVLIANFAKKNIDGYIGANSFLEMGFAFVTGKPIFLLNPIPEVEYKSEIEAMQPIVINNNLDEIVKYYSFKD